MPDTARTSSIAVIGAGMAGITAARALADAGLPVTVFDKGRGLGGRLATRRIDGGSFDHGAMRITAATEAFEARMAAAGATASAARWQDGWVGVPTMNAVLKPEAEALAMRLNTRVTRLERAGGWVLHGPNGTVLGRYDAVISTIPAPQAAALVAGIDDLADRLVAVRLAPQWALMLGWAKPPAPAMGFCRSNGALDLIANISSKPGRPGALTCWVAHASADWTRAHLELPGEAVAPLLLREAAAALGERLPAPDYMAAHRWRYARTERPLGSAVLSDDSGTLLLGGDWALGRDVEHAWQSGKALAAAVQERVAA